MVFNINILITDVEISMLPNCSKISWSREDGGEHNLSWYICKTPSCVVGIWFKLIAILLNVKMPLCDIKVETLWF